MKAVRLTLLSLTALLLASCFQQSKPVRFTDEWPKQASSYEATTKAWTRRGLLRAPISQQGSQLMELYAVFLSTDWRAAYVGRQAELQKLSKAARSSLEEEQRKLASEAYVVKLLVSTYHPEHNDLHRDRSIWRVALIDSEGNEIPAETIEKDRRPRSLIAAEFENFGDFAEAYEVTFPRSPEILQGKEFALRIGSSLGTVEVKWKSQ
jgi:hypothetical protein